MTRFYSETLGKHDRTGFTSGNDRIDGYFRQTVSQDVKRRYAACYVIVERDSGKLAGFHTISAAQMALSDLPADLARKLPRYPAVPSILIGWLGRDLGFRGQDIGAMLLHDALARVDAMQLGVYALFADAIDETAAAFYRRHQFTPLTAMPLTLFLPMATAMQSLIERSNDAEGNGQ